MNIVCSGLEVLLDLQFFRRIRFLVSEGERQQHQEEEGLCDGDECADIVLQDVRG
jgi:hypothetical protein